MEIIIVGFLIATFWIPLPSGCRGILIAGAIVYLVFAIVIVIAGRKNSLEFITKKISKWKFLRNYMEKMESQFRSLTSGQHKTDPVMKLVRKKENSAGIMLLQLIIIALDGLTIYALFNGLGVFVSLFIIFLVLICTRIISVIPFLPGALILYESSMVFLFTQLKIDLGTALVVTMLYRLLSFWLPLPVGWILYRKWIVKGE